MKNLEKLRKELDDLKDYNLSSWNQYGSELCSGEMIKNENKLRKKIKKLLKNKEDENC